MGLPVLMLDRKGVQAGTQASKQIYEPSGGTRPRRPRPKARGVYASLTNAMNAGESLGNKSAACDGYADKTP